MTELQEPTFAPEASQPSEAPKQQDYFAFARKERWYFPDGVTFMEFAPMTEGQKKAFQDKTSKDLVVERASGNARMSVLQGTERWELILSSVTDWNLVRNGVAVPFSQRELQDFLQLTDPLLVEGLEKAIRKANPWLMAEMSVEDIDREIQNLTEMREVVAKREAGEAS